MYTNRILATSGVVLVLLTAGAVVAIRVFAAPAREGGDGPEVDRQIEVERFAALELQRGMGPAPHVRRGVQRDADR